MVMFAIEVGVRPDKKFNDILVDATKLLLKPLKEVRDEQRNAIPPLFFHVSRVRLITGTARGCRYRVFHRLRKKER
jgi:hypothetical protein